MQDNMMCAPGGCKCPHHKMVPLGIVLIGLSFLLEAWGVVSQGFLNTAWPIILIVIGIMKMCGGSCKCCEMKK